MMWLVNTLPMWVAPLVFLGCIGLLVGMLFFTMIRS
jgi:hypothetical protein